MNIGADDGLKKEIEDRYKKASMSGEYDNYDQNVFFPWCDVMECLNTPKNESEKIAHTDYDFQNDPKNQSIKCPNCLKTFKDLKVIYFESPSWTWKDLCGRAGSLVICEDCKKQVYFDTILMS